jgi:hypothetical protein
MDVVALAQYDINYAVASLGTSTTADHIQLNSFNWLKQPKKGMHSALLCAQSRLPPWAKDIFPG